MANGLLSFDTPAKTVQMTSREIADLVESRHDNVRVTIERLAERGVVTLPATQEKATGGRPSVEYVFAGEQGRRDSIVIVAQLSPEFTARLVDRWRELERGAAPKIATHAQVLLGLSQVLVEQERKLVEVDSRVAALEDKMQPDVTTYSKRIPSGMDIKSRQIRRMQKKYGLSAKVCEEVFRFRWDWLDTGLLVANPNPLAPHDKACRAFYDCEVNEVFKNFIAKARMVGKNLFEHKACEGRFRIPFLEASAE